ncbi:hypothetical protein [Herbidospora mongoliensis]|uniref:hypothetical protein n=1 Tax=Herbidospora mongoliensis TaxID=688067 RepID=UPI000831E05F|nr:hypothetical protein [Herbidospora mongoliensis]
MTDLGEPNWDAAMRATAAGLDLVEPAWVVFYGVASRRFWAFAAWPAACPVIVDSVNVDDLRSQMRAAEMAGGTFTGGLVARR